MLFNPTVIQIGTHSFGLLDVVEYGAAALFILLLIVLVLAWRAQSGRTAERQEAQARNADLEYRLAELSGMLNQFSAQTQNNQVHLQMALDERLEAVSHRVGQGLADQSQRTAQSLSQLNERLAVIDAAQSNLATLSGEMLTLKDILANKQTRGAFGQGRMEAIISDGLHARAYAFQGTLSNGTRPDCLISLPDSNLKLVIDAKFPLEAYNDMREAVDETSRREAEARLKSDVMKHVKDISEKYLINGETHETAIMFVPSESVYVEINERFEDVVQRAHRSRVILASPNVLMLLIQTMQAIVRDAAMREQAGVIQAEVVKLLEDVNRMNERIGNLKKHFAQTSGDLDQLGTSADKIVRRAEKIESLELEEAQSVAPRPRLIK
ncbi:MAG: DNA recombination protein RmuC [Alphaproteobacteria bacterium]|nr:DNA recombination protein RmuC [Alphaproteobacteria bacterium]